MKRMMTGGFSSYLAICSLLILGLGFPGEAWAADPVTPGAIANEAPTVTSLGVRWPVQDDDNRNASCRVQYRRLGETTWREGLPLFYVDPDGIASGRVVDQMLAGSLFHLDPGTAYEIKLTLDDPDGGGEVRTVTQATRPVPRAPANATVVQTTPSDLQSAVDAATPGTIIEISAGTFTGTLDVRSVAGTAAQPIVLRGAENEQTVLEGDGGSYVVNARGSQHLHLERLVIQGPASDAAVLANDAVGLVVRKCHIFAPSAGGHGIDNANIQQPGEDFYIVDNVLDGVRDWPDEYQSGGVDPVAINVNGKGHVIAHNRITAWNTAVQLADQTDSFYTAESIDIHNNDIHQTLASAIEPDGGTHNIRIYRNRITDCLFGVSTQPIYGGPVYIFHNVIFNPKRAAFKNNNEPSGVLHYHNTSIRTGDPLGAFFHATNRAVRNSIYMNNLYLGKGTRAIETYGGNFIGCELDYNAYSAGDVRFKMDGESCNADDLAGFTEECGAESHGITVDLSVFAQTIGYPVTGEEHEPPDVRLQPGSPPVDAGLVLPNLNDGFSGAAPDLGAYELGAAPPVYGPRTGPGGPSDDTPPAPPTGLRVL